MKLRLIFRGCTQSSPEGACVDTYRTIDVELGPGDAANIRAALDRHGPLQGCEVLDDQAVKR